MIGIRSAISIRARGQRPHLEAVYMTAPRFICSNTKKALAERGPSIHDEVARFNKKPGLIDRAFSIHWLDWLTRLRLPPPHHRRRRRYRPHLRLRPRLWRRGAGSWRVDSRFPSPPRFP